MPLGRGRCALVGTELLACPRELEEQEGASSAGEDIPDEEQTPTPLAQAGAKLCSSPEPRLREGGREGKRGFFLTLHPAAALRHCHCTTQHRSSRLGLSLDPRGPWLR